MPDQVSLPMIFGVALCVLILLQVTRPRALADPLGRLYGVLLFFLLPILVSWNGFSAHFENSTTTSFCLSCHVMAPNGQSLYFDDPEYLPAAHYQNRRIPRDHACYTCHTSYTMYGDLTAKIRGLRHMLVQITGPPDELKLYEPYKNRECLHCHWGARSFEENPIHSGSLEEFRSNELSCLVCHSQIHHADDGEEPEKWHPESEEIQAEAEG